jgi:HD-like signal output (HDOD) protein
MTSSVPHPISKETIAEKVKALPSPPAVIARLIALSNNDAATLADYENLVSVDAGLTASLLKLANSAAFGLPRKVQSLRQAVLLLGTARIVDIAVLASYRRMMPKRLVGYGIDAEAFWLHNAATGILSESIAEMLHLPDIASAFTAGLLHDTGKLVISTFLAEWADQISESLKSEKLTLFHAEHAMLGTDHAEVGEAVIRSWNLPELLALTTRYHHTPREVTDPSARALTGVVHVANVLAHSMGIGSDIGQLHRELDGEMVKELGLDSDMVERALCSSTFRVMELRDALR